VPHDEDTGLKIVDGIVAGTILDDTIHETFYKSIWVHGVEVQAVKVDAFGVRKATKFDNSVVKLRSNE
jgi:hypothetical protein